MTLRSGMIVACAPLAAVFLMGCGSASGPILAVDRAEHDFAPAREWVPSTEFTLTNIGSAPLTIGRIETSCGCTTAELKKTELAAGESTALHVKVNRPPIGTQKATVTISSNSSKDAPLSLALTCRAFDNRPRLVDFKPRRVSLRNSEGNDVPEIKIVAFERADQRLVISGACDLPYVAVVEASCNDRPLPSPEFVQREYRFIFALTDQHPFGRFEGRVVFQMQQSEGDGRPPEFVLPIDVVAVRPLYAEPDTLFATLAENEAAPEWNVKIHRRPGTEIGTPTTASSSAEWLSAELHAAEPHDSATADTDDMPVVAMLRVRIRSYPMTGSARAEVTVRSEATGSPDVVIPVVVAGAQRSNGQ